MLHPLARVTALCILSCACFLLLLRFSQTISGFWLRLKIAARSGSSRANHLAISRLIRKPAGQRNKRQEDLNYIGLFVKRGRDCKGKRAADEYQHSQQKTPAVKAPGFAQFAPGSGPGFLFFAVFRLGHGTAFLFIQEMALTYGRRFTFASEKQGARQLAPGRFCRFVFLTNMHSQVTGAAQPSASRGLLT